jgi:hypothetical protein
MPDDQTRLDALRKGITAANDNGYVAIRVADLRWLLDQVKNCLPEPPAPLESEGELDEPEHDRD